jgi:hypothetical protein
MDSLARLALPLDEPRSMCMAYDSTEATMPPKKAAKAKGPAGADEGGSFSLEGLYLLLLAPPRVCCAPPCFSRIDGGLGPYARVFGLGHGTVWCGRVLLLLALPTCLNALFWYPEYYPLVFACTGPAVDVNKQLRDNYGKACKYVTLKQPPFSVGCGRRKERSV